MRLQYLYDNTKLTLHRKKNWTKLLFTILVAWQLLSGLCLTHRMLCDCDIEEKRFVIVVYFKKAPQRDNRVKVSALLRAGDTLRGAANLVGVSRTTVYAIKKHMDDGEGVNRRTGSGQKTVVDHDSLRHAIGTVAPVKTTLSC